MLLCVLATSSEMRSKPAGFCSGARSSPNFADVGCLIQLVAPVTGCPHLCTRSASMVITLAQMSLMRRLPASSQSSEVDRSSGSAGPWEQQSLSSTRALLCTRLLRCLAFTQECLVGSQLGLAALFGSVAAHVSVEVAAWMSAPLQPQQQWLSRQGGAREELGGSMPRAMTCQEMTSASLRDCKLFNHAVCGHEG